MFSKKYFIIGALSGFILLLVYIISRPDGKLHIAFCDVGQGDAAYLRMPNGSDMLIDGGPNDKVLGCLGKNMPFYDHEIDIVVLSHPQKDHLQGLISVLERYEVKNFIINAAGNESDGYKKLVTLINNKKIPYRNLYTGDYIRIGGVRFDVLWPEKSWLGLKFQNPTDKIQIEEGKAVLGMSTDTDLNDFSYYLHLKYGEFDALFTGDGDKRVQPEIMTTAVLGDIEVLKFPHHGSKNGVTGEFLDKVKPEAAVISVGKNPWGHPTVEALKLLTERGINVYRTDTDGEIDIDSDGRDWQIRK